MKSKIGPQNNYFLILSVFCSILYCLIISSVAYGEAGSVFPLELTGHKSDKLGKHLEIFIDRTKRHTIASVRTPSVSNQFEPSQEVVPNLGITDAAVWVRFSVSNPQPAVEEKLLAFEFPQVDLITFHIPLPSGGFKSLTAGHSVELSEEMNPNRHYVFPFSVPPESEMTFYVRVVSSANMVLPMTIWDPAALARKDHKEQMIFGIIYGILVAFIAYFAALAIRLENHSAMWFTFYVACLGLLMSSYQGYLQELIRPMFTNLNTVILMTLIGLLYFTGAKFLRTFLNIGNYSKRIDRIIHVLQWMGIGFIPMNLIPNAFTPLYGFILVGAGPLFSTGASIYFWIKGIPNARYFAVGWIIGHLMSEIDLLRVMGVIPWIPAVLYLLPAAIISSIVFFSMAIMEQSRRYREYARTDNLTGIANRRLFDQALVIEWNRNLRNRQPISVLMADIDHFKAYNDTYGHAQGDECLKVVARVFEENLRRAGDLAARYGGEEFIAVLPDTGAAEATFLGEKIRKKIESIFIRHDTSETADIVTISIGTCSVIPNAEMNPAELMHLADKALYQAKNSGRNRVVSLDKTSEDTSKA